VNVLAGGKPQAFESEDYSASLRPA